MTPTGQSALRSCSVQVVEPLDSHWRVCAKVREADASLTHSLPTCDLLKTIALEF